MSIPRYEHVKTAHAKLLGKLQAGAYKGDAKKRATTRLQEYEHSLELLEGATNRRVETPSVGKPGATISVGPE
jgi:Ni,Fe-hydrogenase III large subunit